jgi:hypothetical protein
MGCFQKQIGNGVRTCTRTRTKEAETECRWKTGYPRGNETPVGRFPCRGSENGEAAVALIALVADGREYKATANSAG